MEPLSTAAQPRPPELYILLHARTSAPVSPVSPAHPRSRDSAVRAKRTAQRRHTGTLPPHPHSTSLPLLGCLSRLLPSWPPVLSGVDGGFPPRALSGTRSDNRN